MQEVLSQNINPLEKVTFPPIKDIEQEVSDLENAVSVLKTEVDTLLPAEKKASFAVKVEQYLKSKSEMAVAMLDRVKQTDIFREIESVGIETTLTPQKKKPFAKLRSLLAGKPAEIPFISDSTIQHIDRSSGYDAVYENGKIKTSAEDISANSVLLELTVKGVFPQGIRQIFHESIHKKQHEDIEQTHKIRTRTIPNTILYEALARRGADYPAQNFESIPQEIIDQLSHATKVGLGSNYYSSENARSSRSDIQNEWRGAFEVIDILQGSGLTIGEISKLFEDFSSQKRKSPEGKSLGLLQFIQEQVNQRLQKMSDGSTEEKQRYIQILQKKRHLEARKQMLTTRKLLLSAFSALP